MNAKFTASKNVLKSALAEVMKSNTSSQLPILECVLVAIEGQHLCLAATNLVTTTIKWIPLSEMAFEEAAIAIPGKLFSDIVTIAPTGDISLEIDTKSHEVEIVAGKTKNKVKCLDPKEFPPLPAKPDHASTVLPAGAWQTIASRVATFAHPKEDARPTLTGVSLEFEQEAFRAVATDGFRLAVQEFDDVKPGLDAKVVVPAAGFINASPALGSDNPVEILHDQNKLIAFTEDAMVAFQLLEGKYPEWQAIVPESFKYKCIVTPDQLEQATKQALIIARGSEHKFGVTYVAEGNAFVVIGDDKAGSQSQASMLSDSMASMYFVLNGVFVLQAVAATKDAAKLTIRGNGDKKPVEITSDQVPGYKAILMPMLFSSQDQERADELKALATEASTAMGMEA
jgi:DNA polymerase-3 subunit beta